MSKDIETIEEVLYWLQADATESHQTAEWHNDKRKQAIQQIEKIIERDVIDPFCPSNCNQGHLMDFDGESDIGKCSCVDQRIAFTNALYGEKR